MLVIGRRTKWASRHRAGGAETVPESGGGPATAGVVRGAESVAVVVPPAGPIIVRPLEPDAVGFVQRVCGAAMVERLRLGSDLVAGGGHMWLDMEGLMKGSAPNPRATGLFLSTFSRPRFLRLMFAGTVVFTGPDDRSGEFTLGLSSADAERLRQTAVGVRLSRGSPPD